MEQAVSSLAVISLGELYSRLDASERTPTVELRAPEPRKLSRVAVPVKTFARAARPRPPILSPVQVARASRPRPAPRPSRPALQHWLETPSIGLSHVLVLVVSGLCFGVGLSAFALLALARMPGLEFLGL